ncbi:MAG: flotillin family protein [Desulfobacterales bacterium]|nr:flotillin family protein [Desulfobacterales bacterium]
MLDIDFMGIGIWVLPILGFFVLIMVTTLFLASRYKRCPSDKILVVYGKVGKGQSANCIHGGGALIWPLIQDYSYMDLTPMTINIDLQNALSQQNIRINVPSTFTVGISTESGVMNNAAERLLELNTDKVEEMAKEIIFGQLRLTVASLTIEQINQDREKFLEEIRKNVAPELNKIGLYLINVNITDITDASDYIESIGKKAAAEAINQARIDVSEQEKLGAIGQAVAAKEKEIKVAENEAESEKGKKKAEADRRVFVQQQETNATIGETAATRDKEIKVAENEAESEKGKKKAESEKRIYIQEQEAMAISGENTAKADIVNANAELAIKEADAFKRGEVAKREADVEIQKAQYRAEQERLTAEQVAQQEIEKRKVEIAAEAEAERTRRQARGDADAILAKYEAEAQGVRQVLESKAFGYTELVKSCAGDAKSAATLLMIEKLEDLVTMQVEAVKNLKFDKITVWDSGSGGPNGNAASNFISGLAKSLPPLHDIAAMAGLELPKYLGNLTPVPEPPTAPSPTAPSDAQKGATEDKAS